MNKKALEYLMDNIGDIGLISWINIYAALRKFPSAHIGQIKELLTRDNVNRTGNGMTFEDAVAAGGVAIKMMHAMKGDGFKNHSHEYDHITVVASGSVFFHRGDGESKRFGVGLVVTEAGVEHEYIAAEDNTVLCCIHRTDALDKKGQPYLLVEDKHLIGDKQNG